MAGGERILALLETPIEVRDKANAKEMVSITGAVRFDHVSFHYSDDPTLVLDQIDLDVKAGETVALVGETGAGKTTIVKLLTRFHDPTDGCLLIDGVDLRTVTQRSLRRQMGMVLQDPFLFNGSVKENI
jgi:ATP-binding cassette subfamily B protein